MLFTTLSLKAQKPSWQWANSLVGKEGFTTVTKIAESSIDSSVVIIGDFTSNYVVFGTDTLFRDSEYNSFVAKLDRQGNYLWVKKINANALNNIQIDNNGDIYIIGYFEGLEFQIGDSIFINQGSTDFFALKLSFEGELIKPYHIGSLDVEYGIDMYKSNDGIIYFLLNTFSLFSDERTYILYSMNESDTLLKSFEFSSVNLSINKIFKMDGFYVFGDFYDSINIDGNVFIAKDMYWNSSIALKFGADAQFENGFILDDIRIFSDVIIKYDEFYIFGFNDDNTNQNTYYYQKADLDFNIKWNKTINEKAVSNGNSYNDEDGLKATVDNSGRAYVSIISQSPIFYFASDSFPNEDYYISTYCDSYILSYDSTGEELDVFKVGSELLTYGFDINVFSDGFVVVAGIYQDSIVDFGDFKLYNEDTLKTSRTHWGGNEYSYRTNNTYIAAFKSKEITNIFDNYSFSTFLYPNPATFNLKVQWSEPSQQNGLLEIYNLNGQLVKKEIISKGQVQKSVDVSSFTSGTYILTLYLDNHVSSKKWIKK